MPNYLAHYKKLCSTRKNFDRVKSDSTYYESHHIIPRGKHPIQNTYKATCPFCSKTGQMIAMKRWHFQNCKEKEVVYA